MLGTDMALKYIMIMRQGTNWHDFSLKCLYLILPCNDSISLMILLSAFHTLYRMKYQKKQ